MAKILIVDDDKTIRELASLVVELGGHQVLTAEDGPSALKIVKQENPELVLLDYRMPGMDGLQVLREIKRFGADIYVMIFTGQGNEQLAVEFMKAGASDYVLKPFGNRVLQRRVHQVLKMRETEMNNRRLRKEKEQLSREIEAWNRELEQRVIEKSRQLDSARDELSKAEKFAAIGHLSAGLAHDIKNPLNSIALYCELLKSLPTDDNKIRKYTEKIGSEARRIDQTLLDLLNQTTAKESVHSFACLSVITKEVIDLLSIQFEDKRVQFEWISSPAVEEHSFDRVELSQIISNLISNAIDAIDIGGTIEITTDNVDNQLMIKVTDDGRGIAEDQLNDIFKPFFTTREQGSGLGLATVDRIVGNQRGTIKVDSKQHVGTTIEVLLPIQPSQTSLTFLAG